MVRRLTREAVRLDGTRAEPYRALGAVLFEEKKQDEARARQQQTITESELSITVQGNQGKAEYQRSLQQALRAPSGRGFRVRNKLHGTFIQVTKDRQLDDQTAALLAEEQPARKERVTT